MTNTLMRFVSRIVLISYVTSILNLNLSFASQTETITVPAQQGQTAPRLILRLRAHPSTIPTADYQLKIKRKEAVVEHPGSENAKKSGVQIKLKENLWSESDNKTKTHYSFFMADDLAFSDTFMLQQGLTPVVDTAQNVLGLYWQLNEFPDMAVLIGRDGSLAVSGSTNSKKTFQFSSSAKLYLKDFTAAAVHLKAKDLAIGNNVKLAKAAIELASPAATGVIEEGADVAIATIAVHQGNLINKAKLSNTSEQAVYLEQGTTLTNQHSITADSQITFYGNGHLQNQGKIQGAAIKGKVATLDNGGEIEGGTIDLVILEALSNDKLINGDHTSLTCLTSSIFNQGKITGTQSYHLTAFKKVANKGLITGAIGKITTPQGEIINDGVVANTNIKSAYLKNSETGKMINGGVFEVAQGENLGSVDVEKLIVDRSRFSNKGELSVHTLLGNGQLDNSGKLAFTGTEQNRSKLAIKSFVSCGEQGEKASVLGQAVTISRDLHRFLIKNGKLDLGALLIEAGNADGLYQNWAKFTVGDLVMNQLTFDNHGEAIIGQLNGALPHLNNQGYLGVQGETNLGNATLTNKDFVDFKGKAILQKVSNLKDLLAPQGLAVTSWGNQGIAHIQKLFHFNDYENTGEMDITDAIIETGLSSITNSGKLFLTKAIVHSSSGLPFEIKNTDELTLAQGAAGLCNLVNDDGGVDFQDGHYAFHLLKNSDGGQINLNGPEWTIANAGAAATDRTISVKEIVDSGKIQAEGKLIHAHDCRPGQWDAQTFVLKRQGKTLTPADLASFNAHRVELEAENFEVDQVSTILVPHLLLRLTGHFQVDKNFVTQALEAYVKKEFSCGKSNKDLIQLIVKGPFTLHADTINARYAKIFAEGKTWLKAIDAMYVGYSALTRDSEKALGNGSYLASMSDLTLDMPELQLIYAEIFSLQNIIFNKIASSLGSSSSGLINFNGKIKGGKNIYVNINYKSILKTLVIDYRKNALNRKELFGDPSLLQAGEDIYFNGEKAENYGGQILANNNIFHQGTLAASKEQPFNGSFINASVEEFSAPNKTGHLIRTHPGIVMAGQTLSVNIGDANLTGNTHGFVVSFDSNTFAAKKIGKRRPFPTYDTHLFVDLGKFAQQSYGTTGFIKTLPDGSVTTDVPVSGGLKPLLKQQLYLTDNSNFYPSFSPNPLQNFLLDPLPLQFVLQQAMAYYGGTLNIAGRSGDRLTQYLLTNAQELVAEHGSAIVSRQRLKKAQKSFLAFEMDNNQKAKAVLTLFKDDINPYQDSGDVSATTSATVHTTKSQTHKGSRLIGHTGVKATSDGTLDASPTTSTKVTHKKRSTHTQTVIDNRPEFISDAGSVTLYGHDELSITAAKALAQEKIVLGSNSKIEEKSADLEGKTHSIKKKRKGISFEKKTKETTSVEHTLVPNQLTTQQGSIYRQLGTETASATIEGSQNVSGQDILFQGPGTYNITATVAHDSATVRSSTKGLTSRQWTYQHTESPVFSQAVLAAAGKVHFEKNHQATLSGVVIQAEDLVNGTVAGMEINDALGTQTCTFRMKQKNPLSGVKMLINQGQEVLAPSVLNVNKIYTEGSALKLVSVEWDQQQTEIMGLYETAIKVPHTWHEKKCKKTGVPPEALAVAAVAFTVMTGGGGVGLLGTLQGVISGTATMAQLGGAVLTTVYHSVGASLISNGGNVEMTLKQTLSKDGLKSLAISLAAEGILDHCGVVAPIGYASFGKICEYAAKKTVVETGVKTAFRQQKFKKILKDAGINFIVSVAGRYGAQEIGKAYGGIDAEGNKNPDGPSLDFGGHKLCHAALGAATGALRGDALAGALGGLVSELVADSFQENKDVIEARVSEKALEQNIIPGTEDYKNLIMAEAKPLMNWSKIAAAAATALARHDINISVEAATNALEHNYLPLLVLAVEALAALNVILTSVDMVDAYEEKGVDGVHHLMQEDAAMAMATMGLAKPAAKIAKGAEKVAKAASSAGDLITAGATKVSTKVKNAFSKAPESTSIVASLALETGSDITKKIHKNSLQYVGDTHLYVIRDSSGKILKYGESAAGLTKEGLSKRAQNQVRKLERENQGERFTSQIIKEFDSKFAVRQSESKYINTHRKVFGKGSLPLNKNNR